MKCNVCGAYNKTEYKKCIRCGNSLMTDEQSKKQEKILIEHQSPLKNTPTFREAVIIEEKKEEEIIKDIKPGTHNQLPDDMDLWTGKPKKHHFNDRKRKSVPVLSLKDESNESEEEDQPKSKVSHPSRTRDKTKSSNLNKVSKLREGQEVEVILPPEPKKKQKKEKVKKKSNLKWGRIVLVSSMAGIVIFGLIIGFFYLFRGVFSSASQIFAGHEEMPNGGRPLVERIMIDGQTWHQITFYGEDGERVHIDEPINDSLSIQNNKTILYLDDSSFIPEEDTQDDSAEYVEVALKASLFSQEGEEIPLSVDSYSIEVPLSPLKIVYPTEPGMKVDYTQVLVKIKVDSGSRVIIDDINLTDIVDTNGYAQKYVNLNEGDNEILVEVETYKHRRHTEIIEVRRPILDVSIELSSPPSTSHEDAVWIEGTVEPNAEVFVDTSRVAADVSYPETVTVEKDDGTTEVRKKFKFKYALSSFGWNDIEMLVETPDGRSATLIHRIERIPDHRLYTRSAWPMQYDYLSQSTSALIGQVFVCNGTVIKREDTDTSRMYLFDVGVDGLQYIMIEYNGNQDFEVGEKYSIYADVTGTYDNYPLLQGRFIYDWEEPEATDPPAEETANP